MSAYPIEDVLEDLRRAVCQASAVILQAPPGAGKTTRVPLAVREVLPQGRIVMLEPRRIAAVSAARWMAHLLGEEVGATVGYTIRFDRRTSAATRIEVVTEGVLTRRLQADPELGGTAMVVFDEFHERSIHADLALALCLDAQKAFREDLKILVMSATLECGPLERVLGGVPVIRSAGSLFPVEEVYTSGREEVPLAERVAGTAARALAETGGDVLVFLPGSGEIWRCAEALQRALRGRGDVSLHPLYGDLPFEEQQRAILPARKRKIVLATNIAETSLTIEGVNAVIDSGLTRRVQHDSSTGMNRLVTVRVSKASAEQRKGRAGRLGPGVCYRLYSRHTFESLIPFAPPEILLTDLSSVALELALWGLGEPSPLNWLDPPPATAWNTARELLRDLGALGTDGSVTAAGREMARLPVHPRVARLLIRAAERNCPALGADVAAVLSERDVLRRSGAGSSPLPSEPDLEERVDLLRLWREGAVRPGGHADLWALRAVDRTAGHLLGALKRETAHRSVTDGHDEVGRLLLRAYPDRVGKRRDDGGGRYVLARGRGVRLQSAGPLSRSLFIVVPNVEEGASGEGFVRMAAAVTEQTIREELSDRIETVRKVEWSEKENRVVATVEEKLGAVVLSSKPFAAADAEAVPLLCEAVRMRPGLLTFGREACQLQGRVALVRRLFPGEGWPDLSEDALLAGTGPWLKPFLGGVRSAQDLSRLNILPALAGILSRHQARLLDERAPASITVPSGRRVPLDYTAGDSPVLAVKLQELFGLADTPSICGGRVAVLVHLLSPSGRPMQVTRDLRSFWNGGYQQVRKELRGRYPKHPWPDDPWNAVPTAKTKRKGR